MSISPFISIPLDKFSEVFADEPINVVSLRQKMLNLVEYCKSSGAGGDIDTVPS
ncbi:MAG: hypothetical protein LN588_05555 [Rickettsia endosymbiont of Bryobia graminum]|nr:hypothetical protein [Rickettsia endosymbiont of Bryobia graminum]